MADKSNISGCTNLRQNLDKEIAILAINTDLEAEKDKIVKDEVFCWSYFCGISHFKNDNTNNILMQKFKALPDERIKLSAISDNILPLPKKLNYF